MPPKTSPAGGAPLNSTRPLGGDKPLATAALAKPQATISAASSPKPATSAVATTQPAACGLTKPAPSSSKPTIAAGPPSRTLAELVAARRKIDRLAFADAIAWGRRADEWIRSQPVRDDAIAKLQEALRDEGLPSQVNRYVTLFWVARLFGAEEQNPQLAVSAALHFRRFLRRDPRTDVRSLRPEHALSAKELWRKASSTAMTARRVEEEAGKLRPKRTKPRSHSAPNFRPENTRPKVIEMMAALPLCDLEVVVAAGQNLLNQLRRQANLPAAA